MKKVLMAVDETPGSLSVLSVYRTMAREPESVVLVHVRRFQGKSVMIDMPSESEPKTVRESMQGTGHKEAQDRKSDTIMRFYRKELDAGGVVHVKELVREGIPSQEILRVAREENVDLIVMGCNGKSGLRKIIAGSTAKDVERSATVPVIVAKTAGRKKNLSYGWGGKAYAAQ
jgi:nucleotide-binding universal stress UspA family protein